MGVKDQPKFYDWETPEWIRELVVKAFGRIALDPATWWTNPMKADGVYAPGLVNNLGVPHWLGPCGLAGSWERDGLLWLNPRYGAFLRGDVDPQFPVKAGGQVVGYGRGWARKLAQDKGEWLALLPCSHDSQWFQEVNDACTWRVDTAKRIAFVDPRTGKPQKGSKNGSSFFYNGHRVDKFREFFTPLGDEAPGPYVLGELIAMAKTVYIPGPGTSIDWR